MRTHEPVTGPLPWRPVLGMALALSLASAACGPAHIQEYTPKKRALDAPPSANAKAPPGTTGSLYRDGQLAGALFVDARAFRVNDVVVVSVEEVADAERSADTDIERRSNTAVGLQAVPIIGPFVPADATVNATAGATADGSFVGGGRTNRRDRLVATVSTVVKQVLANGNLFIEGHRVVLVNNEEHHLYVSGIVRPIDIDQGNSIPSSKIAEAQIEFVGRGVVSDNQTQGVLQRLIGALWPF